MQVNKNGIPFDAPKKKVEKTRKRERPNFQLGQVKYVYIVDGIEVSVVVPDFSPIKKLARSFGWQKVEFEDR